MHRRARYDASKNWIAPGLIAASVLCGGGAVVAVAVATEGRSADARTPRPDLDPDISGYDAALPTSLEVSPGVASVVIPLPSSAAGTEQPATEAPRPTGTPSPSATSDEPRPSSLPGPVAPPGADPAPPGIP
ncbi:MAG: hypothetical protein HOV68_31445, partial [Streptomycetaceae bacterium]|nr:hypothetical protein [Streptomycetaceae bacterium]